MSDMAKGFGCRQAYESLSCRNPRATVGGYGDFELRPMSAMARLMLGSAEVGADRQPPRALARLSRPGTRPVAILSAAIVTLNARASVAGGAAPAADAWTMPCRVMELSPGLSPLRAAVRAAASTVRRFR
jgi:hypothetical protein